MSLWMLGGGGFQAPFNRTFFNVSLGELFENGKGERNGRLTLYLIDGTQLNVRALEELSDYYMIVRASDSSEEPSQAPRHVLPYGAIYRIEVDDHPDLENRRLGFQWMALEDRNRQARKARPKGELSPVMGEAPFPEDVGPRTASQDP